MLLFRGDKIFKAMLMDKFLKLKEPVETLLPLSSPLKSRLKKLVRGGRVIDLCFHKPTSILQWTTPSHPSQWKEDQWVFLKLKILSYTSPEKKFQRKPFCVHALDESTAHPKEIDLVFFQSKYEAYWKKKLPLGKSVVVGGKLERNKYGQWQINHPDIKEGSQCPSTTFIPIYPLTAGITQPFLHKKIKHLLEELPLLPEWISANILKKHQWPSWNEAMILLHNPTSLQGEKNALERLSFDELLAHQIAFSLIRQTRQTIKAPPLLPTGTLTKQVRDQLPFSLTDDQKKVIQEIREDMSQPTPMMRLLQGDVGSGKTIVALMAILQALEAGTQAALLAPTEILARQHASVLFKFLSPLGIKGGLFISKQPSKQAREYQEGLKKGEIRLAIGTHALLEEKVEFKNLGLVVIDEQHRFGVDQRLRLTTKGEKVHVLSMTATPIPRTLQLTNFSHMDVSRILHKPTGRPPIKTSVMSLDKKETLMREMERAFSQGMQVYWICPLVEESEDLDLAAAEERFEDLKNLYGNKVVLVHGKMNPQEKEQAMEKFRIGEALLMVATTVIEVGVDVPQARLMIIEHAERFGLSQLHQLRGRVGRGCGASSCLLLAPRFLSETARRRLDILKQTEDGFQIAEMDLLLRGAGDITGTKQSGIPDYKFADPFQDISLLNLAQAEARAFIEQDPTLSSAQGKALKILLELLYPLPLSLS